MSWIEWLTGAAAEDDLESESESEFAARPAVPPSSARSLGASSDCSRVFVRIYDSPTCVGAGAGSPLRGSPAAHAGVEVHGREWSLSVDDGKRFGGHCERSVMWCRPGHRPKFKLRETLSMGHTRCSEDEVARLIDSMSAAWEGFNDRSPHRFAEALCYSLGVARLPSWVSTSLQAPTAPTVERVYVRVYDLGTTFLTRLHNSMLKSYGAFHTGVEVYGREWSFGLVCNEWSTGVMSNAPGRNKDHTFRETLIMGFTRCSSAQVVQILNEMKYQWRGCTYDLFSRNCHHFSNALCARLGVGVLPPWVNDLATSLGDALGDSAVGGEEETEERPPAVVLPAVPLRTDGALGSERRASTPRSGASRNFGL
mmetsp:Transcript_47945/g.128487  ORF Transcript_47945/g.128487 Transcript_47945/m.128487 type:complete len:368 (+) Transcript_47945:79-1182(+)